MVVTFQRMTLTKRSRLAKTLLTRIEAVLDALTVIGLSSRCRVRQHTPSGVVDSCHLGKHDTRWPACRQVTSSKLRGSFRSSR